MRRQLIVLALPFMTGALLVLNGRPAIAGGGCFEPDTQGSGTSVNVTHLCFSPTILYVQPGTTVTWKNQDGIAHVVAGSFNSWGSPTNLAAGETMAHLFPTAGIYSYSCPLHYGMNAVVIVGDGKASVPLAVIRPAAAASPPSTGAGTDLWPLLAIATAGLGVGYALGRRRRVQPPG